MKKNQKNEVVVAEPVTPEVIDDKTLGHDLQEQYLAAQTKMEEGVKAVVQFGIMLIKTEQIVFADGPQRGNNRAENYGIQGWMAKNCPKVNYKTAMRWKVITSNIIADLNVGLENGMKLLSGEATDLSKTVAKDAMKRRDELFAAGSLRKLTQMIFNFARDDEDAAVGGRPAAEQKKIAKQARTAEAKAIWTKLISALSKNSIKDAIPLLDDVSTKVCYEKLRDLADAMKEHLDEFQD